MNSSIIYNYDELMWGNVDTIQELIACIVYRTERYILYDDYGIFNKLLNMNQSLVSLS